MPSIHYKCVWQSSRQGSRSLSIWRPVGPPGYASLGDVAMPGREPPARPVSMYRDPSALCPTEVRQPYISHPVVPAQLVD